MSPSSHSLVPQRRARNAAHANDTRLPELAPGQYWRPRKALKSTQTLRAKHPAIPKGTVLLVTTLEQADGILHSVHLAPHPTLLEYSKSHIHIDDFLEQWELARDADAVRSGGLAELNQSMHDTQAAMLCVHPSWALPPA